ncbi:MAG: helix-turn-helix domain-containing protein [Caulobacteraceae bacterium]
MADLRRISAAMKTKDDAFFKRLGARIAQARKDQDMTQVQLAERLGIAQQTLAHYEVGRARIAADLLPVLAETLELSLDEMLIGEPAARPSGKRGPASRLQQQIDAIGQLPKAKQKFVVEMIDTVLAQHAL